MGYEKRLNKYVQIYWKSVLKMLQNVGKSTCSTAVGKTAELMIPLMCIGKSEIIPDLPNSMIKTSYSYT